MQYRLRTLMIVLALGPMVLAWGWNQYARYVERQRLTVVVPPYVGLSGAAIHFPGQRDVEIDPDGIDPESWVDPSAVPSSRP